MKFLLLFAIFVSPIGAQFLAFPVGPFQMSLFRLAIVLILFFSLFSGAGNTRESSAARQDQNAYSTRFFFIWLLYSAVSVIWAKDFNGWVRNIFFIAIGFFSVYFCSLILQKNKDIKHAFLSLQCGIMIQAAIGWYEIATRNYLFLKMEEGNYRLYVLGARGIPIAMTGNPNNFATMMCIGIFVAVICIVLSQKKISKAIHTFALINYVALLFMTTSRANVLGLLFALSFILLVQGRKALFGMIAVPIILLAVPQTASYIANILQFNFDAGSRTDVVRLGLIQNGFHFLLNTVGFGVGNGQIEYWMGHHSVYFTGDIVNMHNWWMEILTAYGIPIFIGYMTFYCRLFLHCLREYKQGMDSMQRIVPLCICSCMVGFVICSTSSSSNLTSEWLWMFWAICIAYQGVQKEEDMMDETCEHSNEGTYRA